MHGIIRHRHSVKSAVPEGAPQVVHKPYFSGRKDAQRSVRLLRSASGNKLTFLNPACRAHLLKSSMVKSKPSPVSAARLGELIALIKRDEISGKLAKEILGRHAPVQATVTAAEIGE